MDRPTRAGALDYLLEWESLQTRAENACANVAENVRDSAQSADADATAWGQFIERPRNEDQRGVYGTGAAMRILALDSDDRDAIEGGERWLRDQWKRSDSRTSEKRDQGVLYKHVFLLDSLAPNKRTVSPGREDLSDGTYADFRAFADQLWEKRTEWSRRDGDPVPGWGEFCYPETDEHDDPKVISTILALFSLVRSPPHIRKDEFASSLLHASERVQERAERYSHAEGGISREAIAVEAAFCLFTLARFRDVRGDLAPQSVDDEIDAVSDVLTTLLNESGGIDPDVYYTHLFTTPIPDFRNRYLIFLPSPIIVLALLEAGPRHVGRNWTFVERTIERYADEVLSSGAYQSKETGLAALVDQLWIANCLKEFSRFDYTELRLRDVLVEKYRGDGYSQVLVFLVFACSVLAASYIVYLETTTVWLTAVASLLYVVAGTALRSIGLPRAFGGN